MRRPGITCLALAVLAFTAGSASAGVPAGATARCNDATFSFSQTHSGSCSHHGGVSQWLDGSTPAATTAAPVLAGLGSVGSASKASSAAASATAAVELGSTVLLAHRTRTNGCTLGSRPQRACSPGAYYSKLTTAVICSPTF